MSEEYIVRYCAPTLAGIKTANLFNCPCGGRQDAIRSCREMNKKLGAKGLRILPLRFSSERVLLYLYRPRRLREDLSCQEAARILQEKGYNTGSCDGCVAQLMHRLRQNPDFPHEIGLFLGYPPEDVQGFIENKAQNYKCVGCWKVYGDEGAAQKKFEAYKKCTEAYCHQWEKARDIQRLSVAG